MANDPPRTTRVLHVKMRAASPDATALIVATMKNAVPLYQAFGKVRVRALRNVDDRSAFLQVIEYETDTALELNRQKLASHPMIQAWRLAFTGLIEIDVYEDAESADVQA